MQENESRNIFNVKLRIYLNNIQFKAENISLGSIRYHSRDCVMKSALFEIGKFKIQYFS